MGPSHCHGCRKLRLTGISSLGPSVHGCCVQDLDCRLSLDMQAAVAKIKHSKILTIHGTGDTVIPVEDGQEYAKLLPGSDLVVVDGADHNFRSEPEHAEKLIQVVVDYMVKHAG